MQLYWPISQIIFLQYITHQLFYFLQYSMLPNYQPDKQITRFRRKTRQMIPTHKSQRVSYFLQQEDEDKQNDAHHQNIIRQPNSNNRQKHKRTLIITQDQQFFKQIIKFQDQQQQPKKESEGILLNSNNNINVGSSQPRIKRSFRNFYKGISINQHISQRTVSINNINEFQNSNTNIRTHRNLNSSNDINPYKRRTCKMFDLEYKPDYEQLQKAYNNFLQNIQANKFNQPEQKTGKVGQFRSFKVLNAVVKDKIRGKSGKKEKNRSKDSQNVNQLMGNENISTQPKNSRRKMAKKHRKSRFSVKLQPGQLLSKAQGNNFLIQSLSKSKDKEKVGKQKYKKFIGINDLHNFTMQSKVLKWKKWKLLQTNNHLKQTTKKIQKNLKSKNPNKKIYEQKIVTVQRELKILQNSKNRLDNLTYSQNLISNIRQKESSRIDQFFDGYEDQINKCLKNA